jgi:hypothetical protein
LAKKLYDTLIKPLGMKKQKIPPDKTYSEANSGPATSNGIWIDGRKGLEGLNCSFAWEYHDGTGEWDTSRASHMHGYPEIQLFVGLDTAAINYLGADIEYCLGDAMEAHTFSEPTAVILPAGVRHGPVTTKRMYSPRGFGCCTIALTPGHKKYLPEKPASLMRKGTTWSHLIKPVKDSIVIERRKQIKTRTDDTRPDTGSQLEAISKIMLGPGNADHLVWMDGNDLEELGVSVGWGFFSRPGVWHRGAGAHIHPADEILVFLGTSPDRGDILGAEIEIELGKEHELHLITEPCAVIIPAGLPHGPFITRWVDRAFAFFSVDLVGKPEITFID